MVMYDHLLATAHSGILKFPRRCKIHSVSSKARHTRRSDRLSEQSPSSLLYGNSSVSNRRWPNYNHSAVKDHKALRCIGAGAVTSQSSSNTR